MPTIAENLLAIQNAVYGSEVRDAIHDSIEQCYADTSTSATLADAAAENADSKATTAEQKAALANTAASNADAKATLANTAAENADAKAALADAKATLANTAAENADAKATLADTAASNADEKASLADTAASNADEKASLADTAASNANTKASLADAKATLASTAASNADAKAALANTAANNANAKAALANTAAENADAKATLANTAAENADAKATLANTAASNADAKATLANTAAENADTKAALANTAAENANTAATNATTNAANAVTDCNTAVYNASVSAASATSAANRANTASQELEEMTVTYENVSPSSEGGATLTEVNGHKNLHVKLKQGVQGSSFVIKGNAYATLSALEAGVLSPEVGDQYNVGTAAPYEIYRWTGTQWESQGTIGVSFNDISDSEIDDICDTEEVIDTANTNRYLNISGLVRFFRTKLKALFNQKVDKVTGKQLSTNDFTNSYVSRIGDLESSVTALGITKVDKVTGKQLSTNDYTTAEKEKLAGIAAGANAYSHPSGDGNHHVPATGTSNSGKFLRASATAGSETWQALAKSDITALGVPAQDTTYGPATSEANGLMTAGDKSKIDGLSERLSNPNLLINGYLRYPVNQRGVSSGASLDSADSRLDGWYATGNVVWTFGTGVTIPASGSIKQNMEIPILDIGGETVTVSVMPGGGTVRSATLNFPSDETTASAQIPNVGTVYLALTHRSAGVQIRDYVMYDIPKLEIVASESVTISAVKLEYGEVSTLIYDAPPNYELELLKCQRYFVAYKNAMPSLCAGFINSASDARFSLALPAAMRCNPPSISFDNVSQFRIVANGTSYAPTSVSCSAVSGNSLWLTAAISGATPSHTAVLRVLSNINICFSAEL